MLGARSLADAAGPSRWTPGTARSTELGQGGPDCTPIRGPVPTPIHWRPAKASCRTEFGHWEADLMHFRRQRDALLTLQERTTRITLGGRLASKRAEPTMDQIVAKLAVLPKRARRSATFDNGGEWARH